MRKFFLLFLEIAIILGMTGPAMAHFGMLIPSDTMIMQADSRTVTVTLAFAHPMEMKGMPLARPRAFGVWAEGNAIDLIDKIRPVQIMGQAAWQADYPIKRPGAYQFYMEPTPYWEPSEDLFIIHYTKSVVAAFSDDTGWDHEIGLKTEIVPLSKPFGLYAGNLFQGIVKMDGKPVPYAEVEIEYFNEDGLAQAPTDFMITQCIKADQNGVFSYGVPAAGWWGFSALNAADFKLKLKSGAEKEVELGAVIWVKFENWQAE